MVGGRRAWSRRRVRRVRGVSDAREERERGVGNTGDEYHFLLLGLFGKPTRDHSGDRSCNGSGQPDPASFSRARAPHALAWLVRRAVSPECLVWLSRW